MRRCRMSLRHEGVLGISHLVSSHLPVSPMYNFANSASYAVDDIGRCTGEMISDLDGSVGSQHFCIVHLLI